MKISAEEVRRIATLAHISLEESEVEGMRQDLTRILDYVDRLPHLEEGERLSQAATPTRNDEPRASLDRESLERNAPRIEDGLFVVPQVIGGS